MTRQAPLDRTDVVSAAIHLADRSGLESTSMRRLAVELSVTPMALYNHVADREDLVDAMVERVIGDVRRSGGDVDARPDTTDPAWRDGVRQILTMARAAVLVHPWLPDAILTRRTAGPAALAHLDAVMGRLYAGGLSSDLVHQGMHVLGTRVWGFTRDVMPTPTLPQDPESRQHLVSEYRINYPSLVRMVEQASGEGCDPEVEFGFAIDLILDGIAALARPGRRGSRIVER